MRIGELTNHYLCVIAVARNSDVVVYPTGCQFEDG